MAHFASIDANNLVIDVIVVSNADVENLPFPQSEAVGIAFLNQILPGNQWVQTSYNGNFRVRYAGIGYVFYPNCSATPYGGFGNQKPYDNWVFDETQCLWIPPVPYPTDGRNYDWDQDTNSWVLSPYQPPVQLTIIGGQ